MRLLLAVLLLAQSAPQSEADKAEAALKNLGERTYRVLVQGKEAGRATLKTRVEGEPGKKVVVLEDRFEVKEKGTMTFVEKAALRGLRLQNATVKFPDGKDDIEASVNNGDAYVSVADIVTMIKTTEAAVGERAVSRLVGLQEQTVGAAFKADILNLRSQLLEEEHDFRCVEKESVEVGGEKRDAFKWEEKWGKVPAGGREPEIVVHNTYWVGADGALLRLKSGDLEMVLSK